MNYYRNMWPRQSHMLAPLTRLTSIKRKFEWTQVDQDDFKKIERIVARNNSLIYPDFNETFKIHTDDSTFQLGVIVGQKGKLIASYSRKMNDDQQRYTVTERELLSILETLKKFRTILLGRKLLIYTDDKNLTFNILYIWTILLKY